MNRNVESHFAQVPQTSIQRSRFDRSYEHLTTFNVGDVVPIYMDQTVMPGDTITLDTSMVVRLQTLLKPIFDNVYLDTYFFAIPKRLLWSHWKEFMGENNDSAWLPSNVYEEPQMSFLKHYSGDTLISDTGVTEGTIADYLGLPLDMHGYVSALPFRAYSLVCDSWFRDENLTAPLNIYKGDSTVEHDPSDTVKGGTLFKASKYHDYFTSALPAPVKGVPTTVPANFTPGIIGQVASWTDPHGCLWNEVKGTSSTSYDYPISSHNYMPENPGTHHMASESITKYSDSSSVVGWINAGGKGSPSDTNSLRIDNLYAYVPKSYDLTTGTPMGGLNVSIADLRNAFQVQKLLERDARSGTRYTEVIRGHFNTVSPDFRLQRPEYLGGSRINISVHQVINQSEGESQFLGNLGAFGMTTDRRSQFTYSASEHCIILGVCVARYDHTYSQGVDRSWLNHSRLDYYWPELAHISEQPVYTEELFVTDSVAQTKEGYNIFGYQEAFAYLRYAQNRTSAEMRPDATLSLASWHLGDDYSSRPYLSDEWIREDKTNVDRVLAVTSEVSNQILLDVRFNQFWTRPMPMFGVPGLVDHF